MLIGFTGATGRTDASHAAILTARAFAAVGVRTTLLLVGPSIGPLPEIGDSLDVVRAPARREGVAKTLQGARAACRDGDRVVVADIAPAWFTRGGIRSSLDMAVVVVGPHEADEREAAALVGRLARPSPGTRTWYLGSRRAGGGPAASAFASAMARMDPMAAVLPVAVPPLGRAEAAALARTAPAARTLRIGFSLAAAIGHAAALPVPGRFTTAFAEASDEALRIAVSADTRSLPDRLRDLADDAEAVAAGLGPTAADLAGAPVLDGWDRDAVAAPILRGRVSGHPNVVENHRVRTSEVFLTDHRTWARTLSRWYVLRTPAGTPRAGLQ